MKKLICIDANVAEFRVDSLDKVVSPVSVGGILLYVIVKVIINVRDAAC